MRLFEAGVQKGTEVLKEAGGLIVAGMRIHEERQSILFRPSLVIEGITFKADAVVEAAADGNPCVRIQS